VTHDIELAFVRLEVADRGAFEAFLRDVVGLVPGDRPHTWRNDDAARRIVVDEGPRNDATTIGFATTSGAAFAETARRLHDLGVATEETDDTIACTAPWGTRVEVVRSIPAAGTPFASALVPGGFLTRDAGFGHVVFAAPDLDAADRFVTEGLGLRRTDWMENDMGGFTLEVRFYHCNRRHHTLALAGVPFDAPVKLHHLMVEANDVDDVGAAFDRAWDAGLPIASGLGKHDNDRMFSFYVVTPAGFQLEFGHGARTITEPWAGDRRYDRISVWGHQPVARPT